MDEKLYHTELLIRYLDGELDETEHLALEARLHSDEALKEELNRLKTSMQAINFYGIAQQVAAIHREEVKHPIHSGAKIVRMTTRKWIAIAASVLLFISGAGLLYISNLSNDKVFKEAFVDYSAAGIRSNVSSSPVKTAYQQNDYTTVFNLSKTSTLDEEDQLLIALARFKTNDFIGAIEQLSAIAASRSKFKQDAEFYLAMCYLKTKKYDAALQVMNAIHNDKNHLYHERITGKEIREVELLKWKQ